MLVTEMLVIVMLVIAMLVVVTLGSGRARFHPRILAFPT
jgi:hypothetical protein